MDENIVRNVPEGIKAKIEITRKEVEDIINDVAEVENTKLEGAVSFKYTHSAPTDILTSLERAQSVCFITRYEHLPILNNIDVIEIKGKFFLGNIGFIRHILNEYRSIIMNLKDSIYFSKIHKFCYEKLKNNDPKLGLVITVQHESGVDITNDFSKLLGEKNKAIREIIKKSEFGYIYNGILQHSDHTYTKRFWEEYYTGKLNYIFIKHALLVGYVKDCLYWHYKILNQLTFPKLGPL